MNKPQRLDGLHARWAAEDKMAGRGMTYYQYSVYNGTKPVYKRRTLKVSKWDLIELVILLIILDCIYLFAFLR